MHVPGWWAGAAAEAVTDAATGGVGSWIGSVGLPWALVALAIVSLFRGWLRPGRDVDRWEKAYWVEVEKNRDLIDGNRITQDVMRALEKLASQKDAAP